MKVHAGTKQHKQRFSFRYFPEQQDFSGGVFFLECFPSLVGIWLVLD